MSAERLLLTAVTMQRNGAGLDAIEAALIELARSEDVGCHCRRDFSGHVDIVFSDGQCLRFDGRSWALRQEEHVAPLYVATLAAFGTDSTPVWGA